jgi:CRISPR-associated DxTHG motif protein
MTIITFLGLIGGSYSSKNGVRLYDEIKEVEYSFSSTLQQSLHIESSKKYYQPNMLPLLIELFPDAKIIAVGTEASIAVQKALFKKLNKQNFPSQENTIILESEQNFESIFSVLGALLEEHHDVIVDISHSFRHIPILMTISMLIENILNLNNIKQILFAKELKREERYEIIDISRYLDLSNVSYALASFTDNYTVVKNIHVKDKDFKALLKLLEQAGEHILANSFEALFVGTDSQKPLIKRINTTLEAVMQHHVSMPLKRYLKHIKAHITELEQLIDVQEDERYYTFAKLMYTKGFMLNAITLLDESLSRYALQAIRKKGAKYAKAIEDFEYKIESSQRYSTLYNRYELATQAKNIIKFHSKNKKAFLADEALSKELVNEIDYKKTQSLRDLIYECDKIRNDLAHGNTYNHYENIKTEIGDLVNRYSQVCNSKHTL